MATYSGGETIVNTLTTSSNYTVPAGRYAKITVQKAIVGTSSAVNIGNSNWTLGGTTAVQLYPDLVSGGLMITAPEFVLVSGQTATITGASTFTLTVREFNNP
jgi:hypothetical protein|tara:strand:+ start:458 stop:766 length:309 start_codon:yes stop_codon:yes gene_type:complete